jgi:hypothetical protein
VVSLVAVIEMIVSIIHIAQVSVGFDEWDFARVKSIYKGLDSDSVNRITIEKRLGNLVFFDYFIDIKLQHSRTSTTEEAN